MYINSILINNLKIILLLWELGYVDTFNAANIAANVCAQYSAIVAGGLASNPCKAGPVKVFLEPIFGLGVGCKFIFQTAEALERKKRIATIAAFLSTSATSAVTLDPNTNGMVGGGVAALIAHMRDVLKTRGGSMFVDYVTTITETYRIVFDSSMVHVPKVHPYYYQFTDTCSVTIQNMFYNYKVNQYLRSTNHLKPFSPVIVPGVSTLSLGASSGLFISFAIGGAICGGLLMVGGLIWFQKLERKRYIKESDVIIDIEINN